MPEGIALGSEGERKLQLHGYLGNDHFISLKQLSITLHGNGMEDDSPHAVWSITPSFQAPNGWTLDKPPLFPNPFARC
jgi:hypothetical protein